LIQGTPSGVLSYACRLTLDIWCDGPSEKKILPFLDPCMFSHNLLHEPRWSVLPAPWRASGWRWTRRRVMPASRPMSV